MISIENTGHLNFIFHKQRLRYLTQHGNWVPAHVSWISHPHIPGRSRMWFAQVNWAKVEIHFATHWKSKYIYPNFRLGLRLYWIIRNLNIAYSTGYSLNWNELDNNHLISVTCHQPLIWWAISYAELTLRISRSNQLRLLLAFTDVNAHELTCEVDKELCNILTFNGTHVPDRMVVSILLG